MKETLLLTKHMKENPENSHLKDVYEKNNGYSAARKVLKEDNPGDVIEEIKTSNIRGRGGACLLYTSPSPRDLSTSRMPSSA